MTKDELRKIINDAFEAVDKSVVGPMFIGEPDEKGNRQMSTLPYNTFLYIIRNCIPVVSTVNAAMEMTEAGDNWKQSGD